MEYILTHNGYNREYFNSIDEVENYIADVLEKHRELKPEEIYRGYGIDNKADNMKDTIKSVIIWQYRTLYTEVFMIEERIY